MFLGRVLFIFTLFFYFTPVFSHGKNLLKSDDFNKILIDSVISPSASINSKFNRINKNSLNGFFELNTPLLKNLIVHFTAEDSQILMIKSGILLVQNYISLEDINHAEKLIKALDYQVENIIKTDDVTHHKLILKVQAYKNLLLILNGEKTVPDSFPAHIRELITQAKELNLENESAVLNYALGFYYYKEAKYNKSLKYLYQSAYFANNHYNFHYYYKASELIVNIHIRLKSWLATYNRVTMLMELFSKVRPSSYYKIQSLFLLEDFYKKQGLERSSCEILQRIRDILNNNREIPEEFRAESIKILKSSYKEVRCVATPQIITW